MTDIERKFLQEYSKGKISVYDFRRKFPVDIHVDKEYAITEIRKAIDTDDGKELELTIPLLWLSGIDKKFIEILNELLVTPNHQDHQFITKIIQDLKSPSSIPFIRRVLESKFAYLTYTRSALDAISKWLSSALYSIGTKEALEVMKEYSTSDDEGVRKGMIYSLNRVQGNKE